MVAGGDTVIRPAREEAFYVMQTLNLGGEDVLAFYDSGSNTHLVEGDLAERVGFTVLSNNCVPIGVVGGGSIWSEYGQYSCILGPDKDGVFHELECQGLTRISSAFPEFNLRPLHREAAELFPKGDVPLFPMRLGGDRVKLLIGIKSIGIAPRLLYTLPNGLGIFSSTLYDVYGSRICFGGTHRVFSHGYSMAGVSSQHVQILFTQMAQAYMRSPYTGLIPDDFGSLVQGKERLVHPDRDIEEALATSQQQGWDVNHPSPLPEVGCQCAPDVSKCSFSVQCSKAAVPLAKLKGLIDEQDIPVVTDFRCDKCSNCPTCRLSSRERTRSLQEAFEQDVIEKSVTVDFEAAQVRVDLPFIKPPVEFLSKRHGGSDNYYQASRVYRTQCNKPNEVKEQILAAQKDLADRGFMVPLASLPTETQELIQAAPFRHFFPWRAVYKPGSVSTPVRLVVDPSCTGLNLILAKGENMLTRIPDVLIRFRTKQAAWCTDVSKLYNMLYLNDSSLPYSLFLFSEELSPDKKPDVWVMTRAWYGVTSTGNQSGVGLERLAQEKRQEFPLALEPLTVDRYVDDIASGADDENARSEQIRQTAECLKAGGFSTKYTACSGAPPPSGSSSDGRTVGCLGVSWDTEADLLSPALAEMNLNKKVRGKKAVSNLDVTTRAGIETALREGLISRSHVLSRIAEFYDPCGWFEPVKLQLKLMFQELNALDWSDPVPEPFHDDWILAFLLLGRIHMTTIPRCVVPPTAVSDWKIRLICLADAAEGAGGTAIYGGVELPDGSFSCSLLCSRSKLMTGSVPRNELEAILLTADTALAVAAALGDRLGDVFYFTDSTVAMCWVLNRRKRLRMFVHNRVQSILHAIHQVRDGMEVTPLYHIDGESNLADMVTKPRSLHSLDVGSESAWQQGLDWMRLPTADLPLMQFTTPPTEEDSELVVTEMFQDVEVHSTEIWARKLLSSRQDDLCTPEIRVHSAGKPQSQGDWLHHHFDFVHLGWHRAVNRLTTVCKATLLLQHRRHTSKHDQCCVCQGKLAETSRRMALRTVTLVASREVEEAVGRQKLLKTCRLVDDVWAATGRLEKEGALEVQDLDFSPFFDAVEIRKVIPVMLVKSPLFFSLLNHTHFVGLPHSGVEATLARIKQSFFPVGDARKVILAVKKACSKCRIILKKVVDIELADMHALRTTIAPPSTQ